MRKPKPTRAEKAEQVKRAAFMFARITRDADEIAKALDVTPRTVFRLLDRDDFHTELDALDYEGERNFRTKPAREMPPLYDRARAMWDELADLPRHKRGRVIADTLGVPIRTIRSWIARWKEKPDERVSR